MFELDMLDPSREGMLSRVMWVVVPFSLTVHSVYVVSMFVF